MFSRDSTGRMDDLPNLNIDCGMGFERLVSVVQGVRSSYDTDLFAPLIHAIQTVLSCHIYHITFWVVVARCKELI